VEGATAVHKSELTSLEREAFDRAMAVVEQLPADSQRALIEHAVATTLRYHHEQDPRVLDSWSAGLLQTLRLQATSPFAEALGEEAKFDPSRPAVNLSGYAASLSR
jgi:hypothetical protein